MSDKVALVLDDQPMNVSFIKVFLMSSGFKVFTASDGLQGLEHCKNQKFDLVFSDIEMPNMNGFEFLRAARKLPEYGKIPIVILSTLDDDETKNRMKTLGASFYVVKPFTNEKMQLALKTVGLA